MKTKNKGKQSTSGSSTQLRQRKAGKNGSNKKNQNNNNTDNENNNNNANIDNNNNSNNNNNNNNNSNNNSKSQIIEKKEKARKQHYISFLPFYFFIPLLIVRLLAAYFNIISDCDETYNYWEPTAFLITDYGFETWEYAPQYGLRSYGYLLPQWALAHFFLVCGLSNVAVFYCIRIMLSLFCFACEYYFIQSLNYWFSKDTIKWCLFFETFSSGMFNCCAAYLPQQFVLCCTLLALGNLIRHYHSNRTHNNPNDSSSSSNDSNKKKKKGNSKPQNAILFFAVGCIVGCWPFAGLLGLPLALYLCFRFGFLWFFKKSIIFGSILTLTVMVHDYYRVAKKFFAPLNIVLYNLHFGQNSDNSESGQNLYGIESWTYYVKNLFNNFNIVYILALLSPFYSGLITLLAQYFYQMIFRQQSSNTNLTNVKNNSNNNNEKNDNNNNSLSSNMSNKNGNNNNNKNNSNNNYMHYLINIISPFFIWYLFFTYMAHKEERFLFVVYPLICVCAALTISYNKIVDNEIFVFWKSGTFGSLVKTIIIFVFVILSISRTFGQCYYYGAPLKIWSSLDDIILKDSNFDIELYDKIMKSKPGHLLWTFQEFPRLSVCVGKEWYRIPTSLLTKHGNISWIQSEFDGQLPALFTRFQEGGTRVVKQPFNDQNKMEMSRFVKNVETDCHYIVDLWEKDIKADGYNPENWDVVMKLPFLDRDNTPFPLRSYFMPSFMVDILSKLKSNLRLTFSDYVVLKNKLL